MEEPGQYQVKFKFVRSGQFILAPLLNGETIADRSLALSVRPGPPSYEKCRVAEELTACYSYVKTTTSVLLVDDYMNGVKGVKVTVKIITEDGQTDVSDDFALDLIVDDPTKAYSFRAEFEPDMSGDYIFQICFEDEDENETVFKEKKFTVIPPPADPQRAQVWGPGIEGATLNEPTSFEIAMADSKGFVVVGEQPLEVYFEMDDVGHSKRLDFCEDLVDNQDGTFTVTYIPKVTGLVVVFVRLAGENVKGSPFHVHVDTESANSRAESESSS